MKGKVKFICAILSLSAILVSRSGASVLPNYNLVVFGNLSDTSDVEGTALIGGNLVSGAVPFGTSLSNQSGIDVLTIGGNIDSGATATIEAGGNLLINGSQNGTVNLNGGGSIVDGPPPVNVAALQTSMINLSNSLNSLAANSTVTLPGSQPSNITFNANFVNGTAIFDVTAASIFQNSNAQEILLDVGSANPATSTVIINVSGSDVNFDMGNMEDAFDETAWASQILWNFNGATDLNIMNSVDVQRELWGSVLAPSAMTTLESNSPINGTVVVGNADLQGEIHLPQFDGVIPVPEPTSLAIVALGLIPLRRPSRGKQKI
jgi:choice-of-anchor A domain-containing protein